MSSLSLSRKRHETVVPVLSTLCFLHIGRRKILKKKATDMASFQFLFLLCCFWLSVLIVGSETSSLSEPFCSQHQRLSFGVVIDESSRLGREQKIAMEVAVQNFKHRHCLNLFYPRGSSASAVTSATDLINRSRVDAIIGTVTVQEAALITELSPGKSIPIISLSLVSSYPMQMEKLPSFIPVSTSITHQMQCVAALIGHFRWRKVILIQEQANSLSEESGLFNQLSDSLFAVDSSVEHHISFPRLSSVLDPTAFVEKELMKLRSKKVRIFLLMQASLEFSVVMFQKARELGMMGRSYVWIVSAEITDLLDSIYSSTILNMQGVVGLKTEYMDNTDSIRKFKSIFRRKYGTVYSEEENPDPSIYSLQAYDAIKSLVIASWDSERNTSLVNHISSSKFEGLSGKISFNNGSQNPAFWIVNVIGKSYREVALWTPEFGFSEDVVELEGRRISIGNGLTGKLSSIYWPGGEKNVPNGLAIGSIKAPLRIGVPAEAAFHQFVEVTYDQSSNQTFFSGFSIKTFEAAVKQLPYNLHYEYVPFHGEYDELVLAVHNKSLDAAVGDTVTLADRYLLADFSLPYIGSGLVMVVPVTHELKLSRFIALDAFTWNMWMQFAGISVCTGAIVWLSEYASGNEQFIKQSIPQVICSILWLSVTVISLSQRETINSTASKLLLGAWICVVFVVGASFTAILSSMMTVPRLQSGPDLDYIRNTNAVVGCNVHSFIPRYLTDALHFKPENIRTINSVDDYPKAFESGEIKAAFFMTTHAKVFLAKYCKGYTLSGPTYQIGGSAFVFQKGSQLANDISEAVLKITQSGDINTFETQMLLQSNCSPSASGKGKMDDLTLGPEPFSGLFQILGCIIGVAFVFSMFRLVRKNSQERTPMKKRIWACLSFVPMECVTIFRSMSLKKERVETKAPCDQMELEVVAIPLPPVHNS